MAPLHSHDGFDQKPNTGADAHPVPTPSTHNATPSHSPSRLNLLLSYAGWKHESWADQLPRLLSPMGIRSLTAHTGHEASQLINTYPIHIAVVDLGLPLGVPGQSRTECEAGARMLELLARLKEPPPTVVITRSRTRRDEVREINAALRSGAYACLPRPDNSHDFERLLEVLRRCLGRHYANCWPGIQPHPPQSPLPPDPTP